MFASPGYADSSTRDRFVNFAGTFGAQILEGYGLSVSAQIPIEHLPNPHNEAYLRAKRERLGHTLHHQALNLDAEMLHDERERDAAARAEEDAGDGA